MRSFIGVSGPFHCHHTRLSQEGKTISNGKHNSKFCGRKEIADKKSVDSFLQSPVIVKLEPGPLDEYDPVDTTSFQVLDLHQSEINNRASLAYQFLLDNISIEPVPNPDNLPQSVLDIFSKGMVLKKLIKTFNSVLETEPSLKNLYKSIWTRSQTLPIDWDHCISLVGSRLPYDSNLIKITKQFYELYHSHGFKFIYSSTVFELDLERQVVLGGDGPQVKCILPGLSRNGVTVVHELLYRI